MPASRYETLTSGEIRYTQPEALNDPFEARPGADCEREEDHLETAQAEALFRLKLPTGLPADLMMVGQAYDLKGGGATALLPNVLYEEVNRRYGILSLSTVFDDLLMWSHYCVGHNGFLVGFNSNHPMFKRSENAATAAMPTPLQAVQYLQHRPELRAPVTTLPEFVRSLFFIKGPKWDYEHEWRHLRLLNEATRVIPGPDGKHAVHLFSYEPEAIGEIVLGARLQRDVAQVILDTRRRRYPHARVKQLLLDPRQFRLRDRDLIADPT